MEKTTDSKSVRIARKAVSAALAVLLALPFAAANALIPANHRGDVSNAWADEAVSSETSLVFDMSGTHTQKVVDRYLIQGADGRYTLNEGALVSQEDWKNLGVVGFFLYEGWDAAADIYLRPYAQGNHRMTFAIDRDLTGLTDEEKKAVALEMATRKNPNRNLGRYDDASAFDAIQGSINLSIGHNLCREDENQSEGTDLKALEISPELVAHAVLNCNYSATVTYEHNHIGYSESLACFSYGSNGKTTERIGSFLADNTKVPHSAWYAGEKRVYQYCLEYAANNPGASPASSAAYAYAAEKLGRNSVTYNDIGHYLHNVNATDTCIGSAFAATSTLQRAIAGHEGDGTFIKQTADSYTAKADALTHMPVAEYQKKFSEYRSMVTSLPSIPSRNLTGADAITGEVQKATVKLVGGLLDRTDFPYTGEPVTPEVVVTFDGKTLVEGVDYTVTYSGNVEIGPNAHIAIKPAGSSLWPSVDVRFNIVKADTGVYRLEGGSATGMRSTTYRGETVYYNGVLRYYDGGVIAPYTSGGASGIYEVCGKRVCLRYDDVCTTDVWVSPDNKTVGLAETAGYTHYRPVFDDELKTFVMLTEAEYDALGIPEYVPAPDPEPVWSIDEYGRPVYTSKGGSGYIENNTYWHSGGSCIRDWAQAVEYAGKILYQTNGKLYSSPKPVIVKVALENGKQLPAMTYRAWQDPELNGAWTLLTEADYAKTPEGIAEAKAKEEALTKPIPGASTSSTTPPTGSDDNGSSGTSSEVQTPSTTPQKPAPSTGLTKPGKQVYIKTAADKKAISAAQKALKKIKPTLKSLKAKGKKKAVVTVKPLTKAQRKQVSGLEAQYAYDKKLKKSPKAKTAKVSAKTVTLSGLKSKKTCYVRVRAYKDVKLGNGTTERVFGPWSKTLKVKVK